MHRRTFLAASAATLAMPAIGQAENKRVLKLSAIGSCGTRSGLDHGVRDAQPRLHGV